MGAPFTVHTWSTLIYLHYTPTMVPSTLTTTHFITFYILDSLTIPVFGQNKYTKKMVTKVKKLRMKEKPSFAYLCICVQAYKITAWSPGPPPLGDACGKVPAHCHGHQTGLIRHSFLMHTGVHQTLICWWVVIDFKGIHNHLGEISYYLPFITVVSACCYILPNSWSKIVINLCYLLEYMLIVFASIVKSSNLIENWFSLLNA